MKKILNAFALCTIVLLIGAGCSTETATKSKNPPEKPTPNFNLSDIKPTNEINIENNNKTLRTPGKTEIVLLANDPDGENVNFVWDIGIDIKKTEKFRLIRSEKENPEYNGINYWIQAHESRRDIAWEEFPEGTWYVRMCTFNAEKDMCEQYSNNVTVEK